MRKGFHTVLSSDLDYEGMVIYIYFNNDQLATLNCENGKEQIEFEWLRIAREKLKMPLEGLVDIIAQAKDALLENN